MRGSPHKARSAARAPPPLPESRPPAAQALITPHIGSRTYESIPRQAMRATLNLVNYLKGEKDVIQANKW
jgi:D-3-phosphoglycerate dehydrogenase